MSRLSARNKVLPAIALALLAGATPAHAHTRPHYGGTLHVEVQTDPWQPADSLARRLAFDGLTRIGSSGALQPALALRWKSSNADHRWQFWLRPNIRFHDGSALTPDAVVQSLTRSCTQCPWSAVRALADSIVFTSTSPDPTLPAELARTEYLIAAPDATIGTGPFRLTANANNLVTLAAVDDAWQGRPFLDTIEIAGRRAIRSQWLDLAAGRADLVDIPIDTLRQAQQEHLAILQSNACDLLVLTLDPTGPLADDLRRDALALAIDRQALASTIFQKQGESTASLLPNALTGYAFLFPSARDLTHAQAYPGVATGPPLTLLVDDPNPAVQLAGERIALNLREVGFHIQIEPRGSAAPPSLTLKRIHLESSDSQSALQQMLAAFNQPLPDSADSQASADPATLYRAERTFLDTHRAIPLLYLPRAYAVAARVHGLRLAPDGTPILSDVSLPAPTSASPEDPR